VEQPGLSSPFQLQELHFFSGLHLLQVLFWHLLHFPQGLSGAHFDLQLLQLLFALQLLQVPQGLASVHFDLQLLQVPQGLADEQAGLQLLLLSHLLQCPQGLLVVHLEPQALLHGLQGTQGAQQLTLAFFSTQHSPFE
jgi:hypothetical protein